MALRGSNCCCCARVGSNSTIVAAKGERKKERKRERENESERERMRGREGEREREPFVCLTPSFELYPLRWHDKPFLARMSFSAVVINFLNLLFLGGFRLAIWGLFVVMCTWFSPPTYF